MEVMTVAINFRILTIVFQLIFITSTIIRVTKIF